MFVVLILVCKYESVWLKFTSYIIWVCQIKSSAILFSFSFKWFSLKWYLLRKSKNLSFLAFRSGYSNKYSDSYCLSSEGISFPWGSASTSLGRGWWLLTQDRVWGISTHVLLTLTIHNRSRDRSARGLLWALPFLHPCKQQNSHWDSQFAVSMQLLESI